MTFTLDFLPYQLTLSITPKECCLPFYRTSLSSASQEHASERFAVRKNAVLMTETCMENIYERLVGDRIRLLVLEPGSERSELACEIVCGTLNNYYQPYEALSYAWGDQGDVVEVHCNGYPMRITRNLHDALMAIRLEDATRTIWVDALCINQADLDERNHQVQLMANIYSGAARVVVWLVEDDSETTPALEMITHCAKAFELKTDAANRFDVDGNNVDLSYGLPSVTDPKWKSLSNLLHRPWFKRAWVVQEVALANEIIFLCGRNQISWEDVLKAMFGIFSMDLGDVVANGNESIICLHFYQKAYALSQSYLAEKNEILRLEVLLFAEGARLASDDRDKVFALLGLANDVQSNSNPAGMPIQADYGSDAADVYTEITRTIINYYQSLTILAAAGVPVQPGTHNVPSWVCDRSLKPRANLFMSPAAKQRFSACNPRANCRFTSDHKGLVVRGVVHDTISVIDEPYSNRNQEQNIIPAWGEIASIHKSPVSPQDLDTFCRTLVGNFGQDGPLTNFELESFFPWYKGIMPNKAIIIGGEKASVVAESEEVKMRRRFSALVHRASGWRSFFLTESGLMGIGPPTAVVGDLVCVVEGANVPIVLRQLTSAGKDCHFHLVGESYVHGLMDGEGYKMELVREMALY